MKKITLGVPCYNEEENIELMYEALTEQMKALPEYDYEIIFADNDSKDSSQDILRGLAAKDKHVKVILNQTNFGPARSGINIYRNATGDAYIGIPCDFQEPPEMIPDFISEWEKGYNIVWGQKTQSKESKIKYACRKIFYGIINFMSDYPQLDQTTGFGLMDRSVVDTLLYTQLQDPDFAARNLVAMYGFKIKLLPYTQRAREHGVSSYNVSSYFDFAITSLVNTSIKPLHIMTVIGFLTSILSLLVAFVYFIIKITHWYSFDAGIAPIIIVVAFMSAIQLFCMGMLGEYIAILVRRVTKKPLVIEKEKLNFEEALYENSILEKINFDEDNVEVVVENTKDKMKVTTE